MIVCADDYGLHPDNDAAILELAQAGRISAVSVMVALGSPPTDTAALAALGGRVDLGLHLVLTGEGRPLSERPLSLLAGGGFCGMAELTRRGLLGLLRPIDLFAEIQAQLEAFQALFGRQPDYLDGHLHVQQLPGVRGVVAQAAAKQMRRAPFYVRNAWEPIDAIVRRQVAPWKHLPIAWPARHFRHLLKKQGVATNNGFAGVYDYHRWRRFPEYLETFVRTARHPNAIIMTHPGHAEPWRRLEFETLRRAADLSPNRFQTAEST
ncbi:MAG: ChbG/HpnK family deacetylase [Kiritimatiellia bacterium]